MTAVVLRGGCAIPDGGVQSRVLIVRWRLYENIAHLRRTLCAIIDVMATVGLGSGRAVYCGPVALLMCCAVVTLNTPHRIITVVV